MSVAIAHAQWVRFKKPENILYLALLLLGVTFAFLAVRPARFDLEQDKAELVAQLDQSLGGVKHKSSGGLAWAEAESAGKLYAGDQIFTERSSEAAVKFIDGTEIKIAENSLIRIDKGKNGKTTIDMSKGFVSGKFTGDEGITLKMGDTNVALKKGAEIQINVDPNDKSKSKLSLLKGDAAVESENGAVLLKQDQVLQVDSQGRAQVTETNLKALLPTPNKILDEGLDRQIYFRWESLSPRSQYKVVLARDAQFQNRVAETTAADKAASLPMPATGTYFWKVQAQNPKTLQVEESLTLSFTVVKTEPPTLLAPALGQTIIVDQTKPDSDSLVFMWRSKEEGQEFELELSKSRDFANPELRQKVTGYKWETKAPQAGTYYWRVRHTASDTSRPKPFTRPHDFIIHAADLPGAPVLVAPQNGARLAGQQATTLSWQKVNGAQGYQLEISRGENSAALFKHDINSGESFSFTPQASGRYVWRVRAVDVLDRPTNWSTTNSMLVGAETVRLLAPIDLSEITLTQKEVEVEFAWSKLPGVQGYEWEIALDQDFKQKGKRQTTAGNQLKIPLSAGGTYYWRVRSLSSGLDPSPYSPTRRLVVKELELLPSPKLLERYWFRLPAPLLEGLKKLQADAPWPVPNDDRPVGDGHRHAQQAAIGIIGAKGGSGLAVIAAKIAWQQFTSIANAQTAVPVDGPVDIKWQPIEGAKAYLLELARDASFAKAIIKQKLPEPRFRWPTARPGRYFLRAASLDARDKSGPFSRTAELLVTWLGPELLAPPDQAVIKNPPGKPGQRLRWGASSEALGYVLEVATEPDMTEPVLKVSLPAGHSEHESKLPGGIYYWRVLANYRGQGLTPSKTQRFWVEDTGLSAPLLLEPLNRAILETDAETLEVNFDWSDVAAAKSYELELQPLHDVTTAEDSAKSKRSFSIGETNSRQTLAPGLYQWQVRALQGPITQAAAAARPGSWSQQRLLQINALPGKPKIHTPLANANISYREPSPPPTKIAWESSLRAAAYELEVAASGQDFAKPLLQKKIAGELQGQYTLTDGSYQVRIRAVDAQGRTGAYSDTVNFNIGRDLPSPPETVYPEDGSQLKARKKLTLSWSNQEGYQGYRLVIARDPKFAKILADRKVQGDQSTVTIPKDGQYYWYVEGRDDKAKLALKSDIATFRIGGFKPEARPEVLRLTAAYAPSIIQNDMLSNVVSNSLAVFAMNSFSFDGSYWPSKSYGIASEYHRKSAELFSSGEATTGSDDQKPLEYIPQHFNLLGRYRFFIGIAGLSPELHARAGYIYKIFYTYYAASRTALGLTEVGAHHLTFGGGAHLPMGPIGGALEVFFDYSKPIAASAIKIESGSHLLLDVAYSRTLVDRMVYGAGYRYGKGNYTFADKKRDMVGILEETTHSVLGSIGYGF